MYTLPGIYLRLRDRFRDVVLFENATLYVSQNKFSFIGINPVAAIKISDISIIEYKLPFRENGKISITHNEQVQEKLWDFIQQFEFAPVNQTPVKIAQALFGYTTFDAVHLLNNCKGGINYPIKKDEIPLMRYQLYQYMIVVDHSNNELFICENKIDGISGELDIIESIIKNRDIPQYPFKSSNKEKSNFSDEEYNEIIKNAASNADKTSKAGVTLNRCFEQQFCGDEFNVYRALRSASPSSYLFYFDYGAYKILGASPGYNLIVQNETGIKYDGVHDNFTGKAICEKKENGKYKTLQNTALIITEEGNYLGAAKPLQTNPFKKLAAALDNLLQFNATHLNGIENSRECHDGAIGFIGLDGSYNHSIMTQAFLSKNNTLSYHINMAITGSLHPKLQVIKNRLNTLKSAIALAEEIA